MSAYTENMVAELNRIGAFNFASASDFATKHGLSPRSVISKVKSLGIPYTPREVVRKNSDTVRKSDMVREIARLLGISEDNIAGLAKADKAALNNLGVVIQKIAA